MPKMSTRSMSSKLRSFFNIGGSRKPAPAVKKGRGLRFEALEEKAMLTTTVYLDFGEGFEREILTMNVRDLRDAITGPNLNADSPLYNDSTTLRFESLESVIRRQGVNYDGDNQFGTRADYLKLKDDTVRLVQRYFEPFDIDVKVVSSRSLQDVRNTMNANAGDPTGEFDSYVFVTGITNTATNGLVGDEVQIYGIASGIDLIDTLANVTDETVIVNADSFIAEYAAPVPTVLLDAALGQVIAHEAGHTFALRHTSGAYDAAQSDIIQQGGSDFDARFDGIAFFTRYPLVSGDSDDTRRLNAYEKLANDPDIGVNPNGPEFVTGTGANDIITITRNGLNTALVTVTPYTDATYTTQELPTFSYTISTNKEILIDGGRLDDRIIIDGVLPTSIRVRGGQGSDSLEFIGDGVASGVYTPDTATTVSFDARTSYGGTIVIGSSVVRFSEFEPTSIIRANNFRSFDVKHVGRSVTSIGTVGTGTGNETIMTGTVNGIGAAGFGFTNIRTVNLKTGAGNDEITIDNTGVKATGLSTLGIYTATGNDSLRVLATDIATPGTGRITYSAGAGIDSFAMTGANNYDLQEDQVSTTFEDPTTLQDVTASIGFVGLTGENITLTGSGAADTFNIRSWVGTGTLVGLAGNDLFSFNTRNLDVIGKFNIVAGQGRDDLFLNDRLGTAGQTYNITPNSLRMPALDRFFGGMDFDQDLEILRVIGTTGADTFNVLPSRTTEIRVDGWSAPNGEEDVLVYNPTGTRDPVRSGTLPGSGRVSFKSAHQDIVYSNLDAVEEEPTLGVPDGNAGVGVNVISVAASAGANSVPLVQVTDSATGQPRYSFLAYNINFKGGVRVATDDVNGDGIADIVTAPGAGMAPTVKVFDGTNGNLLRQFNAYSSSYQQGVDIAVGDVNGDGRADIITAPSRGSDPVKVFSGANFSLLRSIQAYPTSFISGVTVAAADVDGDGRADIITGPKSGMNSVIQVFSGRTGARIRNFTAFESSFRGGVSLAAGDANGDGLAEIFVGAGVGGNSRVQTFASNGQLLRTFQTFSGATVNSPLRITAMDTDFDGLVEVYVAQGQDSTSNQVRIFNPLTGSRIGTLAVADPNLFGGVFIG